MELKSAEELWVQYEQGEILRSPTYKQVSQSLGLFRDDKDLLRLDGRLGNAHLPTEQNHPILLRTDSHFTMLVILDAHEVTFHSGVQATLNQLRTRFWLVPGRQTVKKHVRHCVICKHYQGRTLLPPQSPDVPAFRLCTDYAFANVGLDLCWSIVCDKHLWYFDRNA